MFPSEIWKIILLYLEPRSIIKFFQVFRDVEGILREKLQIVTRLILKDFTKEELYLLVRNYRKNNISLGSAHSLILNDRGEVYSFGDNFRGQLGLDHHDNISIPTFVMKNIIEISAGYYHSLLLTEECQVYSFGHNECGQLGLGDIGDRLVPILIAHLKNIVQISGGGYHSLMLNNLGKVHISGHGLDIDLDNIIQISAGKFHSLLLDKFGRVYSFGDNEFGQLGSDKIIKRNIPVLIPELTDIIRISAGGHHSLVLNNLGQVYFFGTNYGKHIPTKNSLSIFSPDNSVYIPTIIPDLDNIIDISAGYDYSLFLNNKGDVYALGVNHHGQCGFKDKPNRQNPIFRDISQIATGDDHSIILGNNDCLYSFGRNDSGQLGYSFGRNDNGQLEYSFGVEVPTVIPNINLF